MKLPKNQTVAAKLKAAKKQAKPKPKPKPEPKNKRKPKAKAKKPAQPKRSVGRPAIILDKDLVHQLAAQGMTEQQIADAMKVNIKTFVNNRKISAEFQEALTQGKAAGISAMTNAVFRSGIAGNHSAQRYYLNNRAPDQWKERVEHHIEGEIAIYGVDDDDMALAGLGPEELE